MKYLYANVGKLNLLIKFAHCRRNLAASEFRQFVVVILRSSDILQVVRGNRNVERHGLLTIRTADPILATKH
jgi:hypothetical protein